MKKYLKAILCSFAAVLLSAPSLTEASSALTDNLVYASDKQMRDLEQLSLENPPMIYPVEFNGLQKNKDGLYRYDDLISLFRKSYQI